MSCSWLVDAVPPFLTPSRVRDSTTARASSGSGRRSTGALDRAVDQSTGVVPLSPDETRQARHGRRTVILEYARSTLGLLTASGRAGAGWRPRAAALESWAARDQVAQLLGCPHAAHLITECVRVTQSSPAPRVAGPAGRALPFTSRSIQLRRTASLRHGSAAAPAGIEFHLIWSVGRLVSPGLIRSWTQNPGVCPGSGLC